MGGGEVHRKRLAEINNSTQEKVIKVEEGKSKL